LHQGAALEDVQHLAGHADARTTRLYDSAAKGGDAEPGRADFYLKNDPTLQIIRVTAVTVVENVDRQL
jgi:hypothetical protein